MGKGEFGLVCEVNAEGENGFPLDFVLVIPEAVRKARGDFHRRAQSRFAGECDLKFARDVGGVESQIVAIEGEVDVADVIHVAIEIEVAIADQAVLFDAQTFQDLAGRPRQFALFMDWGDRDPVCGRNRRLVALMVEHRPKRDASDDDLALFIIDDVVAGVDEGFGEARVGLDRDFLVCQRPTGHDEVVAHDDPIKIFRLQGFNPIAQKGAAAD